MCLASPFIHLLENQSARFDVPGLHLHKNTIITTACNNVEDKHGRFAFTLVPDYTPRYSRPGLLRPNMKIIGEELGITFSPSVLAVEIINEILAIEQDPFRSVIT